MKFAFTFLLFVLVFSKCNTDENTNENLNKNTFNPTENSSDSITQYTEEELITFFDSIGHLPSPKLLKDVWHYPDSLFKNRESLNHQIDTKDFEKLKKAAKTNLIDIELAKRIFINWVLDSSFIDGNMLHIEYIPFSENTFTEFAISIGPTSGLSWENTLYFFSKNQLLSKHKINHRYGLEIDYFTDNNGKTTIYYKENYTSGSGVWWFNFYFYKYSDNQLTPVLNMIENSNLSSPWGLRSLWFKSKIETTKPLTLKMVYNNAIADSTHNYFEIINDSTFVNFIWDEVTETYKGDYKKSKLTEEQLYSYYLDDNELLYLQSHYNILKKILNNGDRTQRKVILAYLNEVKNNI